MSVQGIGNHAAHQLPQEMRGIQKQEPVSAPVLQNDTDKPSKQSGLPEYDEYIPGEKREPIGLYKLTHDDEGNPIIEFDDPMKADNVSPQEAEDPSKEAAPAKGKPGRKGQRRISSSKCGYLIVSAIHLNKTTAASNIRQKKRKP